MSKSLVASLPPGGVDDETVLEVMALSACADGVNRDELDAIATLAKELPSFQGLDASAVKEKVEAAFSRLDEAGLEPSLKAIAARATDAAAKKRIFYAAAIVQHADGRLSNQENELLLDLADALGLDDDTSHAIANEIAKALDEDSFINEEEVKA